MSSNKHNDLEKRMRTYESVSDIRFVRRMPLIIQCDGRAFHSFTRGLRKPFDDILIDTMQQTMRYLCENIQGCVLGYTQSDEINLVVIDYQTLETSAWFDNRTQKICGMASSMATIFNRYFEENVENYNINLYTHIDEKLTDNDIDNNDVVQNILKYRDTLFNKVKKWATFNTKAFNIPEDDVTNFLYWRQTDAIRNSIQMVGQAYYSQKQLNHKKLEDIKKMLMDNYGISWDALPTYQQRGSCCIREDDGTWLIDREPPIFKGYDRKYVENRILVGADMNYGNIDNEDYVEYIGDED